MEVRFGKSQSVGIRATPGTVHPDRSLARHDAVERSRSEIDRRQCAEKMKHLTCFASAIVGNMRILFSVLSKQPDRPRFQWLLVTLIRGVCGSKLLIGSAAGVALMGSSQGRDTFMSHLRWAPLVALGYLAGIETHLVVTG